MRETEDKQAYLRTLSHHIKRKEKIIQLRVVDLAGSEKFNIPYDLPQA